MGAMTARDLAELGSDNIRQSLEWHLTSNHYPPIPKSMIDPCLEAIEAYKEEDYQKQIRLPEGVGYKGLVTAPASAIVESHHLEAWLED